MIAAYYATLVAGIAAADVNAPGAARGLGMLVGLVVVAGFMIVEWFKAHQRQKLVATRFASNRTRGPLLHVDEFNRIYFASVSTVRLVTDRDEMVMIDRISNQEVARRKR